MLDGGHIALVAAAFFGAGVVKGILGLGMPIIVVAVLGPVLGLSATIGLLIVPGIVTNVRQALRGGSLARILRRQRSVLLTTVVGIWFGTGVLAVVDTDLLTTLLGIVLSVYALYGLVLPPLPPPGRLEPLLAPGVGISAGLMCGMVGIWAVPGVIYYTLLRLRRDELVQTLGVTFVVLSVALAASLATRELLRVEPLLLSAMVLPAALGGILLGEKLRDHLPDQVFRRLFLIALLGMGLRVAVTS